MNNSFRHTTRVYLKADEIEYYTNELKKRIVYDFRRGFLAERRPLVAALLDSSLITASSRRLYDTKLVQCGNYYQLYKYEEKRSIKVKEKVLKKNLFKILGNDKRKNNMEKNMKLKKIELKNINRSKFALQRLVKANEKDFKTFITLTFADNISDVKECNNCFRYWREYMRQKMCKKNMKFMYVCVPEFQKRGAIHYHLLTNIDYDSDLFLEVKKLWNPSTKKWQVGKPLKSWSYGYSMAKNIDSINVVGYLTKYMTKDIDNRLFGYRKYLYSYNLKRPSVLYLNSDVLQDNSKIFMIEKLCNLKYSKSYLDKYDNIISFLEYS